MVRKTGNAARKASPYGIYAFLTAAAVAPLAGPTLGAAGEFQIALNQLGGIGGNHLATVLAETAGRLRERGGEVDDERWLAAVAEALADRLAAVDRDEGLVDDVRAVLRAVDGVEYALAESAEHARELHRELLAAVAAVDGDFGEVRWMLGEVRDTVDESARVLAELQRDVLDQRVREREQTGRTHRLLVGMARLRKRLRHAGEAPAAGPCPYPGLSGFGTEDARWFHGREAAVAELTAGVAERLGTGEPLMVVGASGAGKSSLLRAGLLPALAAGELPGSGAWPALVFTPGASPLTELAARLASRARVSAADVVARLRTDPTAAAAVVRQAVLTGSAGERLVIVVDQVEELFTHCADPDERAAFAAALAATGPSAVVVAAVRSDFFGQAAELPALRGPLSAPMVLGAMSPDELRRVIVEPAHAAGLAIEPGLADRMLADLGTHPGAGTLPLLAHALRATWHEGGGVGMTLTAYQRTGGIGRSVADTAEAVYAAQDPATARALRSALLRMVTVVGDLGVVRRRVPRDTVAPAVVEPWIAARLLTADEDAVYLSHEALLAAWPRMRDWIAQERDDLRTRQRIDDTARDWVDRGRSPDDLLRGATLAAARDWAAGRDDLTEPERDLLHASVRAHTRAVRTRRGVAIGLVLALLAAVAGGTAALTVQDYAAREAAAARSRQLAAKSLLAGPVDPTEAIALAVDAWRESPTQEARGALISASMRPSAATVTTGTGYVQVMDTTSDGRLVAFGDDTRVDEKGTFVDIEGEQPRVTVWDTTERRALPIADTGHTARITDVEFSPDDSLLATASLMFGEMSIWRVADGERVRVLPAASEGAWHPDGDRIAAMDQRPGSGFGVAVWNVDSGERVVEFGYQNIPVADIRYDPTGTYLVVSRYDGSARIRVAATGQLVATVEAPPGGQATDGSPVITVSDALVATTAHDRPGIRLWDLRTGNRLDDLSSAETADTVEFTDGGRRLVTSAGGTVSNWDVASRTAMSSLPSNPAGNAAVATTPDNTVTTVATVDGTITQWRTSGRWHGGASGAATDVAFHPSRSRATVTFESGPWREIDPDTADPLRWGPAESSAGDVVHGPDGTRAIVGRDGTITVTGADGTGRTLARDRHAPKLGGIALSPDGTFLAVVPETDGPFEPAPIQVRRTDDLDTVVAELDTGTLSMRTVLFTGTHLFALTEWGPGVLRGWRLPDFTEVSDIDLPAAAIAAAPTPDGDHVVLGTTRLHVLDLRTGEIVREFGVHASVIRTLAVSPDGTTVATGTTGDPVVRLWDLATDEPIANYTGHSAPGSINELAFSPDGRTLASAATDGYAAMWPTSPADALTAICDRLAGFPEEPSGCGS